MSLPVISQSTPEARDALDQLLLLLDPRWHDLLLLNDLVQKVFRRIEKWAGGIVISFHVFALTPWDILELAACDGILDTLIG